MLFVSMCIFPNGITASNHCMRIRGFPGFSFQIVVSHSDITASPYILPVLGSPSFALCSNLYHLLMTLLRHQFVCKFLAPPVLLPVSNCSIPHAITVSPVLCELSVSLCCFAFQCVLSPNDITPSHPCYANYYFPQCCFLLHMSFPPNDITVVCTWSVPTLLFRVSNCTIP